MLALVLSVARMKFVGTDDSAPTQQGSQIDHSFPFLESLNEVLQIFCCSSSCLIQIPYGGVLIENQHAELNRSFAIIAGPGN